jgi:hypothetical protein
VQQSTTNYKITWSEEIMNMPVTFKLAPYDAIVLVLTLSIVGVFIVVGFTISLLPFPVNLLLTIIGLGPSMLIFLGILSFAPKSYVVSPQGIVIKMLVWKKVIPLANIRAITNAEKVSPTCLFVSSPQKSPGIGGYMGVFQVDKKDAYIFASRLKNVVRINAGQDIYFLSPADRGSFCKAVQRIIEINGREKNDR